MEMKSSQVVSNTRIDDYIHELCHQPIDKKTLKKYKHNFTDRKVHARIAAREKS